MIIYENTKRNFNQAVLNNEIAFYIEQEFERHGLDHNNYKETRSWMNSLNFMRNVLDTPDIPDDVKVAIEYRIPQTCMRVDFMITGVGPKGNDNIVIVELKQWGKVKKTTNVLDHTVYSDLEGGKWTPHPSYQAYSYKRSIENYCSEVNNDNIELLPCAYCHNLGEEYRSDIEDEIYEEWINEAPLFLQRDVLKLRAFIKQYITAAAKDGQLLYKIDHGKIKPQKALQDALYSMLKGNEEFMLLDDQIVAYDRCNQIIEMSLADHRKRTIIIQGGPGTGKSVLAINLLVNTVRNYKEFGVYVTKNAAPKTCYQKILAAKDTRREIDIKTLFPSAHAIPRFPRNKITVGLFDEAHRLQVKPYMYPGVHMIRDCINASLVSIFFIDETQRITVNDIGSVDTIREIAEEYDSEIFDGEELKLHAQFRCNGSDSYIAFINNLLQIERNANNTFEGDFKIKVFDNPNEMRDELRELNKINNKARMVAGYCYDWNVKFGRGEWDIMLPYGFNAKWNLEEKSMWWAVDPESFEEVGCIHTCQGLEFDYVGVFVGKDLIYKDGRVQTNKYAVSKDDKTSKIRFAPDDLADQLIKNTYKVLLTRGQKGCFIYCEDKALNEYLKKRLNKQC